MHLTARTCLCLLGSALVLPAADWPQFLGPTRNAAYAGTDLADAWPKEGPPVAWQKKLGSGWAGPVAADGKVVVFHRVANEEFVECLEARTGRELWKQPFATSYTDNFGFDNGPRATPCIAGGRVFVFGANGNLHALDLATGKPLWSADAQAGFGADKGFFGFACSPLVEGKALLVNLGGKNRAGIVAFDTATGKVLWQAHDEEASYSSPIAATIGGQRHAFFFARHKLVSLDPANGNVRFAFPWGPKMQASVSAAVPVVSGDTVFISAGYGAGAALLRVKAGGVEKLWSGEEQLTAQYVTPVLRDGFLYGFEGRVDTGPRPELRCVELATGKIRWSTGRVAHGGVILAGNDLLIAADSGELVRVAADPNAFVEKARAQILGREGRAQPALADGLLLARDKGRLVAVDLRKR
ncbi:MAG: Pyrrolo-quinoline quinone [Limisphaerales bacterium]|nr:MAG: Pyrrolo-quinoline quinone [Limisphaerales bacterium]KAG0509196.1 MAG: Pyrrolo-quinoline quinone [Limisphaerales bacterium]TXT52464.1 MAG: Pyrrolo-quinoline quinone [Limisphaerales bacterium]